MASTINWKCLPPNFQTKISFWWKFHIKSFTNSDLDADHDERHVGEDELEAGSVRDPVRQLRDEVVAAWKSSEKKQRKIKD
jgi:hypothetical protein